MEPKELIWDRIPDDTEQYWYVKYDHNREAYPEFINLLYVHRTHNGWRVVRRAGGMHPTAITSLSPVVPTMDEAKALFITLSHLEPEEFK